MMKVKVIASLILIAFVSSAYTPDTAVFGLKKFAGEWTYDAPQAPSGYQQGTFTFEKVKKTLTGKATIGGQTGELHEIVTVKNHLSCEANVQGETVILELDFEKDSFSGTATSSMGSLPITGKRK